MRRSIFIYLFGILCCLFSLSSLYPQESDGPHFVSPSPPFCSEIETQKKCVPTSFAMIMRYWSDKGILKNKDVKNGLKRSTKYLAGKIQPIT